MIGAIITGHGCFASGLYSAVKFLTGDSSYILDLDLMDDSPQQLEKRMASALEQLKSSGCKEIIILCDILGGTPFKTAVTLTYGMDNVKVLYGINVAMAVDLCISLESGECGEAVAKRIAEAGRGQIGVFRMEEAFKGESETEGDGI